MKQNYRYDQASARLELEGIADASLGLSIDTISILLLWRLKLIGGPELEGKKEHLQCFMNSVLQYSRYRLSGIKKKIGKQGDFVTISPNNSSGHLLVLTSTKEGVSPVEIVIDDAELTDLTRCFDQLRTDSRVLINWDIPKEKGLNASELISSKLLLRFFFCTYCGCNFIGYILNKLSFNTRITTSKLTIRECKIRHKLH